MNLIDIKERLVLGQKLEPEERDYVLAAINAYRPKTPEPGHKGVTREEVDEIMAVWHMADEIIGIAVQRVMFKCQEKDSGVEDGALMLLGIEIALLRQAARMSLYGRDYAGAKGDAETFAKTAVDQFREVAEAFDDEPIKPTDGKEASQ
jgi:hypothetical protein